MASEGGSPIHTFPNEYYAEGMPCPEQFFPRESLEKLKTFKFRPTDVLVATYPKAGTTWLQEIVWLIKNNADTVAASSIKLDQRFPFLEFRGFDGVAQIDIAEKLEDPRCLKAHLKPYFFESELRQSNAKVVVIMRNVKDTLVSFFNFYKIMKNVLGGFTGTWEDFLELFKSKYMHAGDYFDFNLAWWALRDELNIHFMKYEDLVKDPSGEIRKLASFLEEELTEEQFQSILDFTSFANLKEHLRASKTKHADFMRKGKVGDWRNHFTSEQNEMINQLIEERLAGTGLEFEY